MAETILFRYNCEISGQDGLEKSYGLKLRKNEQISKKKKFKKFEPEKGGLITLDDDLNVNSQKFEPGKKQIWTVDPQDFFELHPIAPH